ncbi:hypothetical protein RJ639_007373 [Escallonia herrerae]|uniref:Integrase catalytic domain-containing protein n=1 Tax=Escallonia herrerae TaxID=1293975 RepID=A0AA89AV39_9ASTE|nr:hypothetical protein RJ639_007373 [Escallonia herrerae]
MWGMDILGPFRMATGQRRFVIVAIDYFTKWIEAEALATITASKCEEFFWKNVICCFGVPKNLITDNGKQGIAAHRSGPPHGSSVAVFRSRNEENLRGNLDLLDDVRAQAFDQMISTKQRVARYYNRRV